jgi:hypothetical protein
MAGLQRICSYASTVRLRGKIVPMRFRNKSQMIDDCEVLGKYMNQGLQIEHFVVLRDILLKAGGGTGARGCRTASRVLCDISSH